jgi:hypothetical protein
MSLPDLHVHIRQDFIARPGSPLAFIFRPCTMPPLVRAGYDRRL